MKLAERIFPSNNIDRWTKYQNVAKHNSDVALISGLLAIVTQNPNLLAPSLLAFVGSIGLSYRAERGKQAAIKNEYSQAETLLENLLNQEIRADHVHKVIQRLNKYCEETNGWEFNRVLQYSYATLEIQHARMPYYSEFSGIQYGFILRSANKTLLENSSRLLQRNCKKGLAVLGDVLLQYPRLDAGYLLFSVLQKQQEEAALHHLTEGVSLGYDGELVFKPTNSVTKN